MLSLHIRIIMATCALLWVKAATTSADTCAFDNGYCDDWVSSDCKQGACFEVRKVSHMRNGPTVDHTTHTDEGSCAYATTGGTGTGASPVATLSRKAKGPLCFTAWYHVSGTDSSRVFISVERDNGECSDIYASQPESAGRWHRVRYSEKYSGKVEIRLHFHVRDTLETASLAVDDLTVESGECPPEQKDGSCDFDWGETCGYTFHSDYTLWKLGDRREGFFLPDYSSGGMLGGVAYLEARGHPIQGNISSPMLPGRPDAQCLRFHYYIPKSGSMAENYVMKVTKAVATQEYTTIWRQMSMELIRGVWTAVDLVFKEEQPFSIIFGCSLPANSTIEKAFCSIDDIKLDDCKGKRVPGDRRCDFEEGWCTWKNSENVRNRLPWQLAGRDVKSALDRPSKDNTFRNASGSFLLLNNLERNDGGVGEIIGEVVPTSEKITQCLSFWSVISGDSDTSLQVLSADPQQEYHRNLPLWAKLGDGRTTWLLGRVAVPPGKRLIFRGAVGPAWKLAYIALDDIAITGKDKCWVAPPGANELPAEFMRP